MLSPYSWILKLAHQPAWLTTYQRLLGATFPEGSRACLRMMTRWPLRALFAPAWCTDCGRQTLSLSVDPEGRGLILEILGE
jgi:hypothetical protein